MYSGCVIQVDASRGGEGHHLVLDQGGSARFTTYRGLLTPFAHPRIDPFFCAADLPVCNGAGQSLPVQACFFGRLQRRHTTGAEIYRR